MGRHSELTATMGEHDSVANLLRAGAAEAIGVFLFVFTGVGCQFSVGVGAGVYPVAFAYGLAIMVLVFATADVSGGHLNPAVTLAFLAVEADTDSATNPKKFTVNRAAVYIICQLLGAVFGALFIKALAAGAHGADAPTFGMTGVTGISAVQAVFIEIITTFTLVITVFSNAVDPTHGHQIAPIPIGFAVILGIIASGNLSGGSMNPARSIGPAVATQTFDGQWVYWVGPMLGAALAGLLYKYAFLSRPQDIKEEPTFADQLFAAS